MRFVLVLVCFFCGKMLFGHDYFVSITELEFNELTQRLEGTIRFTTHDVERAIELQTKKPIQLENIDSDSTQDFRRVESFLQQGIHLNLQDGKQIVLHLEAIHVELNGNSECYFSSDKITSTSILLRLDFLMKEYPQQQNKLTFILREQKRSYVFLKPDHVQELILNPI